MSALGFVFLCAAAVMPLIMLLRYGNNYTSPVMMRVMYATTIVLIIAAAVFNALAAF